MSVSLIRDAIVKTKQQDPLRLGRDTFVYVDISSIDRQSKRIVNPQRLRAGEAPSRARKLIHANDVLVAMVRPNLNNVALVPAEYHNEIASTGFCVLRAKQGRIDARYLFYFAQTDSFVSHLTRMSIGAGYPAVSDDDILDMGIPLPPLPEQQRIVGILARADRLRRLRRYALELSEGTLQAVFVEMFGAGERIEPRPLGALLRDGPKNGLYLPAEQYGRGAPIIRITDFYQGVLSDPEQFKRVDATKQELSEFQVTNGEILINRVNSIEYLGKCALVQGLTEPTLFESNMMRLRVNTDLVLPAYLARFLTSREAYGQIVQRARKAVNQASINQQDVKSIMVPVPPLDLQRKFVQLVARYERLRAQHREAERQAEHLFQTLLGRAFRGGL